MRDEINYAALIDSAMHSIVKEALRIAAVEGLPGEHHFFISFMTKFPGVVLSERLRVKYPEEMTIVLQYQFDKLEVFEDRFAVTLSFDNIPEVLIVPFLALTAFADPSVKFGLQFRHVDMFTYQQQHNDDHFSDSSSSSVGRASTPLSHAASTSALSSQGVASGGNGAKSSAKGIVAPDASEGCDNVVRLDNFRKKTEK